MMNMKYAKELNEMELTQVTGGANGAELSEPFKKLMEFLDDYDVTKDPFYFPDHKLPWDIEPPIKYENGHPVTNTTEYKTFM